MIINTSEILYVGELRNEATHIYSGTKIITDAPLDNHGKAQSFSPTDLLATSLAVCALTVMGIKARELEVNMDGTKATVLKKMAIGPRRVNGIDLDIHFPAGIPQSTREVLEKTGRECPVALSLHPDLRQVIKFVYPD